jgi:hypothetical protein
MSNLFITIFFPYTWLMINLGKTKVMAFDMSKRESFSTKLTKGKDVEVDTTYTYLGVLFKLSLVSHTCLSNVYATLAILNRQCFHFKIQVS